VQRAPRKKLRTTIADAAAPARSPDLLERDFTAPARNQRWVADFTYVRTWGTQDGVEEIRTRPRVRIWASITGLGLFRSK
jgi:transposase InsO family protein